MPKVPVVTDADREAEQLITGCSCGIERDCDSCVARTCDDTRNAAMIIARAMAHERERAKRMESLLSDLLPGIKGISRQYAHEADADKSPHCCDWNEHVDRMNAILVGDAERIANEREAAFVALGKERERAARMEKALRDILAGVEWSSADMCLRIAADARAALREE